MIAGLQIAYKAFALVNLWGIPQRMAVTTTASLLGSDQGSSHYTNSSVFHFAVLLL